MNLVKGVAQVRFGDILKLNKRPYMLGPTEDANLVGMRLYGQGPFHRELKLASKIQKKSHFVIRENDVIYNKLFAWKGTFGVVPAKLDGMFVSDKFPTYELNEDAVDRNYLRWYFRHPPLWEQARQMSTGSAALSKLTLNPPKFLELTIPLPPLSEQRRIVAKIERLAGIMDEACTLKKLSTQDTEFAFAALLKQVRERLVSSHPVNPLGALTTVTAGGTPAREVGSYWGGTIPWVKTGELLDADISGAEEFLTEDGLKNSSAKLFPQDTILIALYGQGQTRGRTGRLAIAAATNQACCAILPRPDILESRYTQYWLRSLYFEMREQSHGGAQPNWNGGMIKAIKIAMPPLSEQRRIVARLDGLQAQVGKVKRLQTETAAELKAMLPAILDRAFKGEL